MIDQYNRKINYMRLSVTDRCNLRCMYCMPEEGICKKTHQEILRLEEMLRIVRVGAALGIEKVRLTGGEPLIRKGIVSLIETITQIDGINEVTMTTNGILLDDMLDKLHQAGLKRINLSLDTLDADRYKSITRGGDLSKVIDVIPKILAYGMKLKINVVLIGGFNDDEIIDFVNLTYKGIDVRFIELMPIGEASLWSKGKYISNKLVLDKVDLEEAERFDLHSPAKYYKLSGADGLVGLINPISCSFCNNCNRIRVTSDGKIKPCLHTDDEIDLLHALRNDEPILSLMRQAISNKPKEHLMKDESFEPIKRDMNTIGG